MESFAAGKKERQAWVEDVGATGTKWPEGKSGTRGGEEGNKNKTRPWGGFHGLLTAERNSEREDAALPASRDQTSFNEVTGQRQFPNRGRKIHLVQPVVRGSQRARPDPSRLRTNGSARGGGVIYVVSKGSMRRAPPLHHRCWCAPVSRR